MLLWHSLVCNQAISEYNEGKKGRSPQGLRHRLVHYDRALKANPSNVEYKLKRRPHALRGRAAHVETGQKIAQGRYADGAGRIPEGLR